MLSAVLFVVSAVASSQAPAIADPWDAALLTRDAFLQQAKAQAENAPKSWPQPVREALEKELKDLKNKPAKEAAFALSGRAMQLTMQQHADLGIVFAANAVLRLPDDFTAAQNFGAVMMHLWPQGALPLLRYAERLSPDHPVALTNLGNLALDLEELPRAKKFFDRALKVAPEHKAALFGLGRYWLARKDGLRAWEYFARADGFTYEPQVAEKATTDEKGETKPPPEPIEAKGTDRWGQPLDNGGSAHVTASKISFPPYPNWPTADAFLASTRAREALNSKYGELAFGQMKGQIDAAMAAKQKVDAARAQRRSMSPAEREAAERAAADVIPVVDDAILFNLKMNSAWAKDRVKKSTDAFQAFLDGPFKQTADALAKTTEQSAETASACMQAGPAKIPECRQKLIDICRATSEGRAKLFAQYNEAYRRWYEEVVPVQERLYKVQANWIRQIQDKTLWESANVQRKVDVFTPFAAMGMLEQGNRFLFAGLAMASFGTSADTCPQEPPKPPPPAVEANPPETAHAPQIPCPFKERSLDLAFGPAQMQLDCGSVEFKYAAGIVVGYKRTFGPNRTVTIYEGVGLELGAKAFGVGGKVGVEGTVQVTMARDGTVKSWGYGEKASLESEAAGQKFTAEASWLLENGTNLKTEYEEKKSVTLSAE